MLHTRSELAIAFGIETNSYLHDLNKKRTQKMSLIVFHQCNKPHCGTNSKMVFTALRKKIYASPVRDSNFCPRINLKLRCISQMFIFLSPVLLVGNQLLKRFRSTFVYLLRVTPFTEVRRTFA